MNAAGIVDAVAPDRIVIFGSVPPHARDLDLLVRDEDVPRIANDLLARGFVTRGSTYVLFTGCSAEAVDLIPASDWRLPSSELHDLFAESVAVDGFANLVRPAPPHALLILACRVVSGGGRLTEKLMTKLNAIEDEDTQVWALARERAHRWGAATALEELAVAASTGRRIPRTRRASSTAEHLTASGVPPVSARASAWRSVIHVPRRPIIVSFSGLDGSGKTSQATALRDSLEQLGIGASIAWSRLTFNPSLNVIASPVKFVLRRIVRPPARVGRETSGRGAAPEADLRQRSRLVSWAWASIVAIANGLTHRRLTRGKLKAAVVITDRYVLDSVVHLRYRYANGRRMRGPSKLVEWISPTPLLAFFLDVDGDTAARRKQDEFGVEQLREQARLYREEYASLSVTRLDGEAPPEDLCKQIAQDVWDALA